MPMFVFHETYKHCVSERTNFKTHFQKLALFVEHAYVCIFMKLKSTVSPSGLTLKPFSKLAPLKNQHILKNLRILGVVLEAWRQPGAPKRSPETPREHTRAPSRPPGSLPEAALAEWTPILGSPKGDFSKLWELLRMFFAVRFLLVHFVSLLVPKGSPNRRFRGMADMLDVL